MKSAKMVKKTAKKQKKKNAKKRKTAKIEKKYGKPRKKLRFAPILKIIVARFARNITKKGDFLFNFKSLHSRQNSYF